MDTAISQQIFDQFSKATKVLIAVPANLSPDSVASAAALKLYLHKLGKDADIVSALKPSQELEFLPSIDQFHETIPSGKGLVVSLNISQKQVDEISYQTQGEKLNIFITAKQEPFSAQDVSVAIEKPAYQVAVILDCVSLEDLGEIFEQQADIFFNTPKINIDNKAENEYFGAINFIDINASSIAEMLSDLFDSAEQPSMDEDIATCLLMGIIAKTNSFQDVHTTPKVFMKASALVAAGGRQQEVVNHIYKTKPLPLLRLWGRALARLKVADNVPVMYSMLNLSDFGKSGSSDHDLELVIKELLENTSSYKIIAVLAEQMGGGTKIIIALHSQVDVKKLEQAFGVPLEHFLDLPGNFSAYESSFADTPFQTIEKKFLDSVAQLPLS